MFKKQFPLSKLEHQTLCNFDKLGEPKPYPKMRDSKYLKLGGIYCLVYPEDKLSLYIGSTTKDIRTRVDQHFSLLSQNKHHCYRLQSYYNKFNKNPKIIALHILPTNIKEHTFLLHAIENWYISQFSLSKLSNSKADYPKSEYLMFVQQNMPEVYKRMLENIEYLNNFINNSLDYKLSIH